MQFPDLYGRGISFILSLIPEGNLLWFLIKFTLLSDLSPMSSDSDANDYTTKKLKNTLQVQRGGGGGGVGGGGGWRALGGRQGMRWGYDIFQKFPVIFPAQR